MKLLTCHQSGLANGTMLNYDPLQYLPTSEELPSSDETPVDNELQDTIPRLLKSILAIIWSDRRDWFFGIDMGYYYNPKHSAIVPDAFLSLASSARHAPHLNAQHECGQKLPQKELSLYSWQSVS
ncbi:Uma2 family endonuclease [Moorena sp. SIOASIH]|uniref:Uma2 family endonuclease n=1 Tax=Moorena sp. SIOASIH TaxID=2607817 RepID=UPI00344E073B